MLRQSERRDLESPSSTRYKVEYSKGLALRQMSRTRLQGIIVVELIKTNLLRGIKQKKSHRGRVINNQFLFLFSQVTQPSKKMQLQSVP